MRGTCVAVLVFATTIAAGQGTTGANGEPIVYASSSIWRTVTGGQWLPDFRWKFRWRTPVEIEQGFGGL